MMPWNSPKWVNKTPIITTLMLEIANAGQIWRMWTERTAAGQSLIAWISVNLALMLWYNFYRVITPNEKWALWGTAAGIIMNWGVIFSVIYFRYVVGVG